jgi:hypothetical protein
MVGWKLGGENESGGVERITNEQLFLRIPDPNTVSLRWNFDENIMERLGLSNPGCASRSGVGDVPLAIRSPASSCSTSTCGEAYNIHQVLMSPQPLPGFGAMQDPGCDLPRINLLRDSVNREEGLGCKSLSSGQECAWSRGKPYEGGKSHPHRRAVISSVGADSSAQSPATASSSRSESSPPSPAIAEALGSTR